MTYPNSRLGPAAFVDGLSNTLCLAEVKAFTPYCREATNAPAVIPARPEEVAALMPAGRLSLGPDLGERRGHTEWVDGRVYHTGFTTTLPPNSRVLVSYAGQTVDADHEGRVAGAPLRMVAAITSRSFHPGVVNVAMMDGSVRSAGDTIALAIWRAWSTRAGGETLSD